MYFPTGALRQQAHSSFVVGYSRVRRRQSVRIGDATNHGTYYVIHRKPMSPAPPEVTVGEQLGRRKREAGQRREGRADAQVRRVREERGVPGKRRSGARFLGKTAGEYGGIVDAKHPVLRFPTENYRVWHGRNLRQRPVAMRPERFAEGSWPMEQPIDNQVGNRRFGICRSAIGKGRLFVCGFDLTSRMESSAARQLLHRFMATSIRAIPTENRRRSGYARQAFRTTHRAKQAVRREVSMVDSEIRSIRGHAGGCDRTTSGRHDPNKPVDYPIALVLELPKA